MNSKNVEGVVLDIFSTVLKRKVDAKDSRLTLNQWDSLKHIEIVFAIEDELGIQFDEDEIEQLDSIEKVINMASIKYAS